MIKIPQRDDGEAHKQLRRKLDGENSLSSESWKVHKILMAKREEHFGKGGSKKAWGIFLEWEVGPVWL